MGRTGPFCAEAVALHTAWVAQRPGSAQREHSKTLQMARQQNQQLQGLKKKSLFFSAILSVGFFGEVFNLISVMTSVRAGRRLTSVTYSSLALQQRITHPIHHSCFSEVCIISCYPSLNSC